MCNAASAPEDPRFSLTRPRSPPASNNTINRPHLITPLQQYEQQNRKMSRYTIDNSPFSNNRNSFNIQNVQNVQNNYAADERSPLLTWLSPLEPKLRHRDIQERRADNIGEWLLQTEEFRSWYDWSGEDEGGKAVLFGYGGPGVGKTFISSLVVDRLCDQSGGQDTAVTCFYLDFAARKEQSVASILGSLLRQVVSGMGKVPEEVTRVFEKEKTVIGGRGAQLSDIVKMLQTITSSPRTFICIDALDECAAVHRIKLLNSLQQILEASPRTRIFITARPHVRTEIEKRLAGRVISVSVGPSTKDIMEYLRLRLDEDETPDAMNESLEADILKRIPENMSEMFLLVSLSIDGILHESTISRRRKKLSKITNGLGLGEVYGATIERIKAQDGDKSRLGMTALMWISHAERRLRADELCWALAVELGSTDFDFGNIPSISTLLNCCQGLITVDKGGSIVRLIHFTLQEYLSAHPDIFIKPHSAMAEICLTYLNSQQVKALSTALYPDTRDIPFLQYCSVYWGVHAKKGLSGYGKSLALELLKEPYSQVSTELLFAHEMLYYKVLDTCAPISGLHCASFFGIVELVVALIEVRGSDINEGGYRGHTPLSWAAHNGHEEVVKILLGRGEVTPDKANKFGKTPLSDAARNGHVEVVKILLEREDVNPDAPDKHGQTPLWYAAASGHEGVIQILLGREEVNPNKPNFDGDTPLSYAARNGREGVVKLLLGREDISPDKAGQFGQTPLACAAGMGHEEVVKILLGREEVNPDALDNWGRTSLFNAILGGQEGVVKILLEREDVDSDKPNKLGVTPLEYATYKGYEEIVTLPQSRNLVAPATI